MVTFKEDTLVSNPLGHSTCPWNPEDDGHISLIDGFFEASSPRKVMGKYVYIYSKRYEKPVPELGVYEPNNGFLSYRFSDSPFGSFHDGGDISFNGGEILKDSEGCGTMTYQWGNNHGSIMEINGKWYVFYHRQTGVNEFSRQAMLEPIDVAMGKDGMLYIGNVRFLNGEPVSSGPVEMTSQGAHINGLDAYKWISAGYACHIYGGSTRAYVKPVYEKRADISAPVVGISSGTTVGFRYLQFGNNAPKAVRVVLGSHRKLKVNIRIDSYNGRIAASMDFNENQKELETALDFGIVGRHAVYFEFLSDEEGEIAEFDRFSFVSEDE
jgi:xylosidase/arabinosidase